MRKVVDLKRLKVFPATITVENRSRSPVYYGPKNVTKKTGLELRYKRRITFDAFPPDFTVYINRNVYDIQLRTLEMNGRLDLHYILGDGE